MTRKHAGKAIQAELMTLGTELHGVLTQQRQLQEREKMLKEEIRHLTNRYALPITDGASEYLDIPPIQKALMLTFPGPSQVVADPEAALSRLGCTFFHQVMTINTVSFLPDAWKVLQDQGVVKETELDEILSIRDNPSRISFNKLREVSRA